MKKSRQIRNRKRRAKQGTMDLDITSLLDILVVILIFLLKSYSTSNVIINVPEEIKLPKSASKTINEEGITLQVSANKIFVDDVKVADLKESSYLYDQGGLRLIPLFNELVRKRENTQNLNRSIEGASQFNGMVNLVMDKSVKYDFLRKLMFTCGEAGFVRFKFVVLAENG